MQKFCLFLGLLILFFSKFSLAETLITPRFALNLEYDDNIYFSSKDEESDLVRYLCPGLEIYSKSENYFLDLDYEYNNVYYLNKNDNSDRHYFFLSAKKQKGPWKVSLRDDFFHSEDPTKLEGLIGINYTNIKYDYNEARMHIDYRISDKNFFRFSYYSFLFKRKKPYKENTISNYPYFQVLFYLKEPFAIQLETGQNFAQFDYSDDFREFHTSLTVIYHLDLNHTLQMRYSFSNMRFLNKRPDYRIYDFGIGLTTDIGKKAAYSLGMGLFHQKNDLISDEKGLSAYLNFLKESGYYYFFFEASVGYDEIYFDGEDLGFSRYSTVGGKIVRYLRPSLKLNLKAFYRRDHFVQSAQNVIERTWHINAYLSWRLHQNLEVSFGAIHLEREANISYYEYRDNRLWFRLTLLKSLSI